MGKSQETMCCAPPKSEKAQELMAGGSAGSEEEGGPKQVDWMKKFPGKRGKITERRETGVWRQEKGSFQNV